MVSIHLSGLSDDVRRRRRSVPWLSVGLLAVLLAYVDGFVVQALQGATGAIERSQHPFSSWLWHSTLLLPVFVVAVVAVLARAYRRYGPELRTARPVLLTSVLLVVVGTAVGVAAAAADAAYNYHLQGNQLELAHSTHSTAVTGEVAHDHPGATASVPSDCTGICLAERQTLGVHVRGVELASGILLLSNLVLVAWVVALRGGELDAPTTRRRPVPVLQPAAVESAEGVSSAEAVPSPEELAEHGQEDIGPPRHLHVRRIGQDSKL
jgi:hypothetical protein